MKETAMQYILFAWANEAGFQSMPPDQAQAALGAYMAFGDAMRKEKVLVSSNRLRPVAETTRVQIEGGKTRVLNGPYAETKEQLGGYFLIDVPDLDAAMSWAARCPAASHGFVEVRPVWSM
jgi:hypothetical protein